MGNNQNNGSSIVPQQTSYSPGCCLGKQVNQISFPCLIPTAEQFQALSLVANLAGLGFCDLDTEVIRCRTLELGTSIFLNNLQRHPFSSESLTKFASYLTIQHVGFIGQPTLEKEASLIIPREPLFYFNLDVFIPYFRNLFVNRAKLNFSEPLTLGLFLLFFHYVVSSGQYTFFDWAGIVPAIIKTAYPEGM